jgi:hypothetical protein
MAFLIFIDTNIFLDFYRAAGREGSLSILEHVDKNHERFITSFQVEMEFKTNRQRVIHQAYRSLKMPDFTGLNPSALIAASRQSQMLSTSQGKIKKVHAAIIERFGRVLAHPTTHDPVYKAAQRLFRSRTDTNLTSGHDLAPRIKGLARRRYAYGLPPRKADDTHCGDAVNWEWLIHCARTSHDHVAIVSRDSDYGLAAEKELLVNDWLMQEFREQVGRRRKLILTDRLSVALKHAHIGVTREEEKAEEKFLEVRPPAAAASDKGLGYFSQVLGSVRPLQALNVTEDLQVGSKLSSQLLTLGEELNLSSKFFTLGEEISRRAAELESSGVFRRLAELEASGAFRKFAELEASGVFEKIARAKLPE